MIEMKEWKWFGSPGHFNCARYCRFHLCTLVGDILVSTVGEYLPDESVREILASSRNIFLEGKGDARSADYMKKIGYDRKYETMAFNVSGEVCSAEDCGCGLPKIIPEEIEFAGYNNANEATRGHLEICMKVAADAMIAEKKRTEKCKP